MTKLNGGIAVLIALGVSWLMLQTQCMAAEDPERLSIEQVRDMLDAEVDVVVIDTRSKNSYESGHIPGSLSMSFPDGLRAGAGELPKDKTIIFY